MKLTSFKGGPSSSYQNVIIKLISSLYFIILSLNAILITTTLSSSVTSFKKHSKILDNKVVRGYDSRFSLALERLKSDSLLIKHNKLDTPIEDDDSDEQDVNTLAPINLFPNDDLIKNNINVTEEGLLEETCGFPFNRLPIYVEPTHYELVIMIDLDMASYEGAVQINLVINTETNRLVLHADESLQIEHIYFLEHLDYVNQRTQQIEKRYVPIDNICRVERRQLLILEFSRTLKANSSGQLHLTFANMLNEFQFRGFYKSSYFNLNAGGRRFHAVTQFQATEARRVFPCWDEPAFKASFNLTLISTPSDRTILANTKPLFERFLPANREKSSSEKKLIRFRQTPRMSTYLLAFIIGEFEFVEKNLIRKAEEEEEEEENLQLRVYTPLNHKNQGQFALECAAKAIQLLEDYFNIDYALKKLDLISIPDFEAGAMENWGLITFKAQQLLFDEDNTSQDSKALIAGTIVHELAHQWFGNLVTMRWWNELWLNEGFATWLEYTLTGQMYPELEYEYYYLSNSHIHALNEDSFRQVHAVEPQELVEDQEEIDHMFDAISYNKAAAVIRLIANEVFQSDSDAFRNVLRTYLSSHQYNLTDFKELLAALNPGEGNKDNNNETNKMIDSWIRQPGHPLLRVSYDENKNQIEIKQERFLTGVRNLTQMETNQTWIVPVSIILSNGDQSSSDKTELIRITLNEKNMTQVLPNWFKEKTPNSWLKLNANFSGFYRVSYSLDLFLKMKVAIKEKQMSPADRLNLLDEAHTLVISDQLECQYLLELISWFSNENHGAVIEVLVAAYNNLHKLYEYDKDIYKKLTIFGTKFFSKIYNQTYGDHSWDQSFKKLTDNTGKSALLNVLVNLNHSMIIERALNEFKNEGTNWRIDSNIRKPIYTAISRFGSEEDFSRLFDLFEASDSREERTRLALAIGKAEDLKRLERTWSWLVDLRRQEKESGYHSLLEDKLDVLIAMLSSSNGRKFVLNLLETKLRQVVEVNGDKDVNNLLEELGLSMMSLEEFVEKSKGLLMRHRSSDEWRASFGYVRRMLKWQRAIAMRGASKSLSLLTLLDNFQQQ